MNKILHILIVLVFVLAQKVDSQNETSKWYFGNQAGLDFMTNPPTILTNGVMIVTEGCSSIADASGNLLFYTDGMTVYNSLHVAMANGTGLFGNATPSQSSIIIKKPGSNVLYYIFTVSGAGQAGGFNYSIVDMSLASGQGSVVTKNANLYNGTVSEKLTATKHCNGTDYWVLCKDWTANVNSVNFRAYQLSAAGVNTTAVISPANIQTTTVNWYDIGCMKISPNGKKLGQALYNYWNSQITTYHAFELYDFDNNTGVVSNSLALSTFTTSNTTPYYGYGCEFSPDGTKFYGSSLYSSSSYSGGIIQWDLCAGSPSAIVSSSYIVATSTANANYWYGTLQQAQNGKIYCANYNNNQINSISVINSPNNLGAACNFTYMGQSVSPKMSYYGLPNFVGSHFIQPPPVAPYTYTVNNSFGCQGAGFTSPVTPNTTLTGCSSIGYSLTSLAWNFGDPASGTNNVSFVTNPVHGFTNLGNYTVTLILYYSCGGGTDTLRQTVNVNQPCISVASTSITCANLGSATVAATGGIGPFSYTWMPSAQTSSVATGLSPGTYTLTVFDFGNNFTYTATTLFTSLIPLTGSINIASSVTCNGANTGTGNVTNLAGGSGTQFYSWFNGTSNFTTSTTNSLSAGIWTVSVIDAVTSCSFSQSYLITQPAPMVLNVSASSPSACVNVSVVLSGTNSGGSPGIITPYTYTWTAGPASNTFTTVHAAGGTYNYTLSSRDSLNCLATKTIAVNFVNNPVVAVSSMSVCPLITGSLVASGASTYTWNNALTGAVLTSTSSGANVFTVTGTALGCSATASGTISLYPVPTPTILSNSPVCNGQLLQLAASGGQSYAWTGPLSYNSSASAVNLNNANPAQSGNYNLLVTSAVGCTNSATFNATVHPTPALSANGSTVCSTGTISLTANSTALTYGWSGPGGFTSNQQNPFRYNINVNQAGFYTVTALSAQGCSNTAVANVSVTQVPTPIAVSNAPQCENSNLSFTVSGADSYQWSGPNGFVSNQSQPAIYPVPVPANGVYSITCYKGPCTVPITHTVVIYPLPVPTASSSPVVCETKSLGLFGICSGSVTYTWAGPNAYNSQTKNPIRINSNLSFSGNYTLVVTDNYGCTNSAITTVNIQQNPTLTALGTTVCLNEPGTIKVNGASSYFWSGPNYFQSGIQNPTITSITKVREGTYTVVGTAANSCTSITTVDVDTRVLPIPKIALNPNKNFCPGETFVMIGYGGVKYNWSGPQEIQYAGESFSHTISNTGQSGTYTLVAEDATGCRNSETIFIKVNSLPLGQLVSSEKSGCVPVCSKFTFVPMSTAVLTSTWTMGQFNYTGSFSHCFNEPGEHIFKGTLFDPQTGCKNESSFAFVAQSRPHAEFRYEPEAPVENSDISFIDMSEGEGIVSWKWYFADQTNTNKSVQHPSVLFADAGNVPVALVVKNNIGCSDTIIKNISIEEDLTVFVPNAFTPNADDMNERFVPQMRGVKKYFLTVYDRWGKIIYEGSEADSGWDGTFAGSPCKSDVYNWKLQIAANSGETKTLMGHVSLLK